MRSGKLRYILFISALAACSLAGGIIFKEKAFSWALMSAAILIIAVFFAVFEETETSSGDIAALAFLTALSVTGRIAFAAVPSFKPCSAVIIIAGIYFGSQKGFAVGALTALVSNFYFSQGVWTPFQMVIWGLTGFFAGVFRERLVKGRLAAPVFGFAAGIVFSLFMDFWSCIWADNGFNTARYLAMIASAAWFTLSYGVSNVVFLVLLGSPARTIFTRLRVKYGIGADFAEDAAES